VKLLTELGIPAIQAHLASLAAPLIDWAGRSGVRVTSPVGARASGITCLAPPRVEAAHRALRQEGITLSLREGALRVAPHCYNTLAEIERLIAVLDRLL
jgi:selenocysteine lyase/cysteine desulfurase